MESRFRILFLARSYPRIGRILGLTLIAFSLSGCAATKNLFGLGDKRQPAPTADDPGQVIDPQVERREIKEPKIDTENFEIGAYAGILGIEDFESEVVYGVRLAYHVTEGFFVEGTVGQSEAGQTSFERLSGGAPILSDDDRTFRYYNLNLGYNILPGEVFFGEGRAFNSNLYLTAGLGATTFAGDDRFTVNFGAGYRFLLNDSVAIHLDVRDHLFDIDILGEDKTTHNMEGHLGLTVFF